jgi:heterotetrameric sarcosine oxidase gamma subunit
MNRSGQAIDTATRRSPLRACIVRAGGQPVEVDGIELSGIGDEVGALADLSTCDRIGLKGRGVAGWLESLGIALPRHPNRLVMRADGLITARLADAEFMLADFCGSRCETLTALRDACIPSAPAGCYDVPRVDSQAALGLVGECVPAVLSAVCPADLRPTAFPPGALLQTVCVGVSAQLWNLSHEGIDRVTLLCDATVAPHVWETVHETVLAEGGRLGPQTAWFTRR